MKTQTFTRIEMVHLFQSALVDLKRNKVRSFLTSLGIMIGVLSVVMLIALGLGLKNYIKGQFESMGANMVMVMPGSGFSSQGGFGAGLVGGVEFDEKDINSLRRVKEIDFVVPITIKVVKAEANGKSTFGNVYGVNSEAFEVFNTKALAGTLFSKGTGDSRAKVAVFGYVGAEKLFGNPKDGVGQVLRFSDQRFKIVAVAEKTGDRDQDSAIYVPFRSIYGSLNPKKTFWAIWLGVKDEKELEQVKKDARAVLLKRYKEDDFSVTEQTEILLTVNQIFNILNLVLVAIGSISLLVGGIGIMNIMYATVTERIKEIGIRRAVGATRKDILLQFLTESAVVSLMGGLLGLVVSILIILVVRFFFPAAINALAVAIALLVSGGIGVFFGVFPARKAAALPPIEAIRYE